MRSATCIALAMRAAFCNTSRCMASPSMTPMSAPRRLRWRAPSLGTSPMISSSRGGICNGSADSPWSCLCSSLPELDAPSPARSSLSPSPRWSSSSPRWWRRSRSANSSKPGNPKASIISGSKPSSMSTAGGARRATPSMAMVLARYASRMRCKRSKCAALRNLLISVLASRSRWFADASASSRRWVFISSSSARTKACCSLVFTLCLIPHSSMTTDFSRNISSRAWIFLRDSIWSSRRSILCASLLSGAFLRNMLIVLGLQHMGTHTQQHNKPKISKPMSKMAKYSSLMPKNLTNRATASSSFWMNISGAFTIISAMNVWKAKGVPLLSTSQRGGFGMSTSCCQLFPFHINMRRPAATLASLATVARRRWGVTIDIPKPEALSMNVSFVVVFVSVVPVGAATSASPPSPFAVVAYISTQRTWISSSNLQPTYEVSLPHVAHSDIQRVLVLPSKADRGEYFDHPETSAPPALSMRSPVRST
mmetsp:Transcript_29962/g.99253  ORF Transcript_29962/g.99253 Transcript_29962/m.99253 type:complete len:481 (-) Transcript_29962:75-1517(-)